MGRVTEIKLTSHTDILMTLLFVIWYFVHESDLAAINQEVLSPCHPE